MRGTTEEVALSSARAIGRMDALRAIVEIDHEDFITENFDDE